MKVFNKTVLSKTLLVSLCLGFAGSVFANDSIGYVATGGVEYIKNDKIAMQSEDLQISKNLIKVDYQFKNTSNKDITETVLFPLPSVPVPQDYNFSDTAETIDSFKILVNDKPVNYQTHVRAFMYPLTKDGSLDFEAKQIDVTEEFKSCGVTEKEIQYPWTVKGDLSAIHRKLLKCDNPKLKQLIGSTSNIDMNFEDDLLYAVYWESQVIYSWQQLFKANSVTNIKHSYKPLIGGSVAVTESEHEMFCIDDGIKKLLNKTEMGNTYSSLGYILTTGANWAKPIENFKLTVERDNDEVTSFCWAGKGKVNKIGQGKFQVVEKNFKPTKDLDVIFIKVK